MHIFIIYTMYVYCIDYCIDHCMNNALFCRKRKVHKQRGSLNYQRILSLRKQQPRFVYVLCVCLLCVCIHACKVKDFVAINLCTYPYA